VRKEGTRLFGGPGQKKNGLAEISAPCGTIRLDEYEKKSVLHHKLILVRLKRVSSVFAVFKKMRGVQAKGEEESLRKSKRGEKRLDSGVQPIQGKKGEKKTFVAVPNYGLAGAIFGAKRNGEKPVPSKKQLNRRAILANNKDSNWAEVKERLSER